jgi:amidohydrolase
MATNSSLTTDELMKQAQTLRPHLTSLRRDFHQHPELSFQEVRTAAEVTDLLTELGLEVQTGVGGTGVVGLLRGGKPGRTLAIRADMDALPMQEQTEASYRSLNPGVMHACGHDAHMAIVLGAATLLKSMREELAGNIKFIFQPGEETPPGGAPGMIEEGVLEEPHVDAVLGLHMYIEVPVGKIALRIGQFLCGMAGFNLTVLGKGAGGSVPHRGVDGIAVAAQVISNLQMMISRGVNPLGSATLTVTEIHGGAGHIMADRGNARNGRFLAPDVMGEIPARMEKIIAGLTQAHGAGYEFSFEPAYPPLINDRAMAGLITAAGTDLLGAENVLADFHPVMAADDFAYFTNARPGAMVLIGIGNPQQGITYPHHHPRFDIDEDSLPVGAALIAAVARRYLTSS